MAEYFTQEHFVLLGNWGGQTYDSSDQAQKDAYDILKAAYRITKAWAEEVQKSLFPEGWIDVRMAPTTQRNKFATYNWAKIYPSENAPEQLAFTVGIAADGFVVKIDTVGLADREAARRAYLDLRGAYDNTSSIVRTLSVSEGLAKQSLSSLVDWTLAAIHSFGFTYEGVAAKLKLEAIPNDLPPTGKDAIPSAGQKPLDREEGGGTAEYPLNRIYYGPPGTGKTFELFSLLKRNYEQAVTSVPLVEWQRAFISEKFASLTWWEGLAAALYDLGGKANVSELLAHPFIQGIAAAKGRTRNQRQTLWGTLQYHSVAESKTVKVEPRFSPAIFDKGAESVWHLAGDWTEACTELIDLVNEHRIGPKHNDTVHRYSFVTFHQSYGYEDFVEGLRPVIDEESETGQVRYEIRPGIFTALCSEARREPEHRFAMVIDEINRGNISKIFGELITLIEPDKREGAANALAVTLPYSRKPFSVPSNVDIIGTMNTADRSLALLDTALRRRFTFVSVNPDTRNQAGAPLHGLNVTMGSGVIEIHRMLAAINDRIEALYDRDHCIGHAYFTPLLKHSDGVSRFDALKKIFRYRVLPLLEEYFFEDWQKIRLVLADNQKVDAACFITESDDQDDHLNRLFGSDHGLDGYTVNRRYAVQDAAFDNIDAYKEIYEPSRAPR
ncbi:hypothetical protein QE369_003222 [Agrobacterium larrymoorei]|uniref:ATPase dynein-related AAA domain-containing protein n=1 Tax=Agrobacterium larrymoorei TaxID=160699 RepID=A0AAJ2BP25_9HYPH|nr:AAA family ATPase [Agrobacterium larrymoorei]MDR6103025.1 hypothetical protein [Agrobacterium larrymoorei]